MLTKPFGAFGSSVALYRLYRDFLFVIVYVDVGQSFGNDKADTFDIFLPKNLCVVSVSF